ncbi:MAG: DMT family transporter [Patescibacteria group bacterium]|nr:DMT family transporter [Patescibacteria group bacterium]
MKKEYLFVILAGILSGLIVFGGQIFANKGLSALEISIIPFALGALTLLPLILLKKDYLLKKNIFWLMVLYGAVGAGTIIGQYTSLFFGIPVAIVVLLLYSQPLWTTLICRFGLKEKVVIREIIACIIVLIGILILINPFKAIGHYNLIGLVLALIGGLSLSGWIIVGSILSKKGSHPISSQFFGVTFSVILLSIFIPFSNYLGLPQSLIAFHLNLPLMTWFWLVIFSIFAVTISQVSYLYGVKKIASVDAGIIMLLEPVVGAILAALFLGQVITLNILVGGILILIANYLVITK